MSWCTNPFLVHSNCTRLLCPQSHFLSPKKQKQCHRQNFPSTAVAYYGLKTPPYKLDALEPYMSKRTLEFHWGKHHRTYVDNLNKQLANDDVLYGYTMDELIKVTYNNGNPLPAFNNAAQTKEGTVVVEVNLGDALAVVRDLYVICAIYVPDYYSYSLQRSLPCFQVWNHDFFWESMQPGGGGAPELGVLKQIEKDFGSFTNFKDKFIETALSHFGSGWVWLVLKREERQLAISKTSNAITPLVWDDIPIICLDMWEHAYNLDYKNDKVEYINAFMNHLVSWNAAMARMARAEAFVNLGKPNIPVA